MRFAAEAGVKLTKRSQEEICVEVEGEALYRFKVIRTLPFSSETRRMGIIVEANGRQVCFLKGADSVMR